MLDSCKFAVVMICTYLCKFVQLKTLHWLHESFEKHHVCVDQYIELLMAVLHWNFFHFCLGQVWAVLLTRGFGLIAFMIASKLPQSLKWL